MIFLEIVRYYSEMKYGEITISSNRAFHQEIKEDDSSNVIALFARRTRYWANRRDNIDSITVNGYST